MCQPRMLECSSKYERAELALSGVPGMPYSNNGDYDLLVEQITDAIVERLNGDGSDQAALCGCTSECFNRCPERMHRIVDAGASRIGLVLGQTASARDWAALVDH